MRTSKAYLEQMGIVLNNRGPKKGRRYELEYAYGAPRPVLTDVKTYTSRDISPRLPAGQLKLWLSAFIDGMDECQRG
jgi:hypothetical protein